MIQTYPKRQGLRHCIPRGSRLLSIRFRSTIGRRRPSQQHQGTKIANDAASKQYDDTILISSGQCSLNGVVLGTRRPLEQFGQSAPVRQRRRSRRSTSPTAFVWSSEHANKIVTHGSAITGPLACHGEAGRANQRVQAGHITEAGQRGESTCNEQRHLAPRSIQRVNTASQRDLARWVAVFWHVRHELRLFKSRRVPRGGRKPLMTLILKCQYSETIQQTTTHAYSSLGAAGTCSVMIPRNSGALAPEILPRTTFCCKTVCSSVKIRLHRDDERTGKEQNELQARLTDAHLDDHKVGLARRFNSKLFRLLVCQDVLVDLRPPYQNGRKSASRDASPARATKADDKPR